MTEKGILEREKERGERVWRLGTEDRVINQVNSRTGWLSRWLMADRCRVVRSVLAN